MRTFFSLLIFCLLVSCNNDSNDFKPQTDADIQKYIADHNLTAVKTESGLYYVINTQGTGVKPTSASNVTVAYKGYYLDGKVFDQSKPEGISFGLNQVIKGWTEGIPYFNEGGEGILLIPYQLGYGINNYNGIPGGSVLVFDIKLLKVN